MPEFEWLVIADDFTGAMDCGLQFAKRGHRTVFATVATSGLRAGALVLSSRSRADDPQDARSKVCDLARGPCRAARRVYKKIDSTMRGNVASELEAVLEVSGAPACILNPAYPRQGRTVVNGRLLVAGVETAATELGGGQKSLPASADIVDSISRNSRLRAGGVPLDTVRSGAAVLARELEKQVSAGNQVVVPDAASDDDLASIAAAAALAGLDRLVAGSAGLADHLEPGLAEEIAPVPRPACERVAVIAGSFTEVTARQVEVAAELLGQTPFRPELNRPGAARQALNEAGRQLDRYGVWIAHPGHVGTPIDESSVTRIINWIGTVASALAAGGRTGFVLTGGETAAIALENLAADSITIAGEIQPGIPGAVLSGGTGDGIPIVTKAGGFGDPAALYDGIGWLRSRPT
jgi:uncharacterized protein YgbK (DUF1537 family)